MTRINVRLWIGSGLVVLGLLMLVERFGYLGGATSLFWGLLLMAAGGYFLYRFMTNMRSEWWAAIPAFALLGIGAESIMSQLLPGWGGSFFLGALGLGFLAVYLSDRQRWWALIPAGILITLAFGGRAGDVLGISDPGGMFLIGFGLTFILVAVLASQQWGWIVGLILLVVGAFVGMPWSGLAKYAFPAALILGGLALILQFARKHEGA